PPRVDMFKQRTPRELAPWVSFLRKGRDPRSKLRGLSFSFDNTRRALRESPHGAQEPLPSRPQEQRPLARLVPLHGPHLRHLAPRQPQRLPHPPPPPTHRR